MYTANRQELVFFEHMNFLTSTVVGRRPCPSTLPENVGQTLIHISIVASRKGGIDRTHVSTQLTKFTVTKNWVAQKKKNGNANETGGRKVSGFLRNPQVRCWII